jgi:hypothetical protein
MTAIETRVSAKTKQATPEPSSHAGKSKPHKKSSSTQLATIAIKESGSLQSERMTKHDRVLTLLSRREGATIPEMMAATDWRQHSVRGFLAGTVKKKLGFALTSKKLDGELRRYRIETKRGR